MPDGAARGESREGVKFEWACIYLGGQGDRPGVEYEWSAAGRARAARQRAGRCQPWFGSTLGSRRGSSVAGGCSLFGKQISSLAMAECRVLLQSVLSGRSRSCSRIRRRRLTPCDRRGSPARASSVIPAV